ncbi:hypothetical protein SAMN06265337_0299 [Hymenobacter gelipurpurascens]|uniref:Uncharacterized protein n=1 Tax=Hymenobacter gelipurpurascens TaxID=89968 RepID=A0A212T433_9BACT|nr:hypothetical protein SAMN06265337_0299 [Hymenobacter gelipurpurascens]
MIDLLLKLKVFLHWLGQFLFDGALAELFDKLADLLFP